MEEIESKMIELAEKLVTAMLFPTLLFDKTILDICIGNKKKR